MLNENRPQRGLAKITHKELRELREKAAAHDQYLAACRAMRQRQTEIMHPTDNEHRKVCHFDEGWLACLREFGEAVVTAGVQSDT